VRAEDFQFAVTADGRPIKIVSIIDEHTREYLGGMVERSITGEHLIDELDRVAAQRVAYPTVLRCDNGPELSCSATASSDRLTPASATNASTSTASGRWPKPASAIRPGEGELYEPTRPGPRWCPNVDRSADIAYDPLQPCRPGLTSGVE
jgi:hypothetical protein